MSSSSEYEIVEKALIAKGVTSALRIIERVCNDIKKDTNE